jgi:MYXO-CTERM domain-containing protein
MRLDIAGGVIPDGGTWFPGDGATDGQLWIHIGNVTPSTLFVLKETPTPAPGALALLGISVLAGGRRRRRS